MRRESANEKSLESNWAWRTARKGGVDGEGGGGVIRVMKRVMRSVWAWGESVLNPPFLPRRGLWDDMMLGGQNNECVFLRKVESRQDLTNERRKWGVKIIFCHK